MARSSSNRSHFKLKTSETSSPAAGGDAAGGDENSENQSSAVHVRFPASAGRRLRRPEPTTCGDGRALWTERPILIRRADGTYELIGTSRNLEGLARWVLSFGAAAEVRGPDQLRRQVAAEALRVWRQHEAEPSESDRSKG